MSQKEAELPLILNCCQQLHMFCGICLQSPENISMNGGWVMKSIVLCI